MRAIKAICLLLCFVSTQTYAQWQWQNPLPQGNEISNIHFVDNITGYVVGAGGTILKTVDAGSTWQVLNSGIQDELSDIYFASENLGFAVTGYGYTSATKIIRTQDSGETWDLVFSDSLGQLLTVYFADNSVGFAGGKDGLLLKTLNGGTTWAIQNLGVQNDINRILFTNSHTGFIVGNGTTILKTNDGGSIWYDVSTGLPASLYLNSISFPTSSLGYIAGYSSGGIVVRTIDEGETWTILSEFIPSPVDLAFSSADSGIMLCYSTTALKTIDGGQNWDEIEPLFLATRLTFTDANTAYFVHGGEFYHWPVLSKTVDFGVTIDTLSSQVSLTDLKDIDFTSRSTGYILGEYWGKRELLKTTDGYHWSVILQLTNNGNPPDTLLSCIEFLNANVGYLAGSLVDNSTSTHEGIVIKTLDGGETWQSLNTGFTIDPLSIYFKNTTEGYLTGNNLDWSNWKTYVIKTLDGGLSWQEVMNDTIGDFQSVLFPTPQIGYFLKNLPPSAGYGIKIWKTLDGGNIWNSICTFDSIYSKSICFPDQNTGYMISSGSRVLKTNDGGYSWTELPNFSFPGNKVFFINKDSGYVLGYNQTWETTDGGNTWDGGNFITSNYLRDLFFFNIDTGYIVGGNGSILYMPSDYFPVSQDEITNPSESFLTVFPNPCRGSTTILYNLESPSKVTFQVFQVSGEIVKSTYIMRQPAGKYEINLEVSDLACGIYLLRIQANDKVETKKMVVIH